MASRRVPGWVGVSLAVTLTGVMTVDVPPVVKLQSSLLRMPAKSFPLRSSIASALIWTA